MSLRSGALLRKLLQHLLAAFLEATTGSSSRTPPKHKYSSSSSQCHLAVVVVRATNRLLISRHYAAVCFFAMLPVLLPVPVLLIPAAQCV